MIAPDRRDFFVSFNRADRMWAARIAWVLEDNGYPVFFQGWNFRGDFVEQMSRAQAQAHRTLAVLPDHHLGSDFTLTEWSARFAQALAAREDRLLPVKVGPLADEGVRDPPRHRGPRLPRPVDHRDQQRRHGRRHQPQQRHRQQQRPLAPPVTRRLPAILLALAAVLLARPASALDDRVEATCSAATGGDITSSTISIVCRAPSDQLEALACDHTKPLEDLAESQKDLLGHLRDRLDLDQVQLQAALKVAGEAGVPPDRIADWLIEIAAHYRQLLQQVEAGAGDDPDAARPEKAVDALTGALSVFDAAGGRARALLDHARAAARGRLVG